MSDSVFRIILLGDRVQAAKWIPYAKMQLRLMEETTQTVHNIYPNMYVAIHISLDGTLPRIQITASPPKGATFVGVPYDTFSYGSFGTPFKDSVDPEDPALQAFQSAYYGKWLSTDKYEVLIGAKHKSFWMARRYPRYIKEYPDGVKYGNINWIQRRGANSLVVSWDGIGSRHPHRIRSFEENFEGIDCQGFNQGPLFIGQIVTGGDVCTTGTATRSGLYRVTGVHEGAGLSAGGYDTVPALSDKVYIDSKVYTTAPDKVVLGAAVIELEEGEVTEWYDDAQEEPIDRYLVAIVGDWLEDRGVYREYYFKAPFKTPEIYTLKSLPEEYGVDNYPQSGKVNTYFPERNTSLWAFAPNGRKAVALRDYLYDTTIFDVSFVAADRRVVEVNITLDNVIKMDTLWTIFDNASAPVTNNEIIDITNYYKLDSKSIGEVVAAVDYNMEGELEYAYMSVDNTYVFEMQKFPGTCDYLHYTEHSKIVEYMWFSARPKEKVLVTDRSLNTDTKESVDRDPEYLRFKSYPTNTASGKVWYAYSADFIDVRFGIFGGFENYTTVPFGYSIVSTGGNTFLKEIVPPQDKILQHSRMAVYRYGTILDDIPFDAVIPQISEQSYDPGTQCKMNVTNIGNGGRYEGIPSLGFELNEPSFSAAGVAGKHLSATLTDICFSARLTAYGHPPVSYIIRLDNEFDMIIRKNKLHDVLKIAESFPYWDASQAMYLPLGVL